MYLMVYKQVIDIEVPILIKDRKTINLYFNLFTSLKDSVSQPD